jgi:hypothetical protein
MHRNSVGKQAQAQAESGRQGKMAMCGSGVTKGIALVVVLSFAKSSAKPGSASDSPALHRSSQQLQVLLQVPTR